MSLRGRYPSRVILAPLFFIMLSGCFQEKPYVVTERIMGTTVTQTIYGENARSAALAATGRMRELESILSFHLAASDLSKLNSRAGSGDVALKPETVSVLLKSVHYAKLTGGSFNVLVGPLVRRWKVTADDADIPTRGEISALMPLIDYHDLTVDGKRHTARLAKKGQMADLGGIAKGYASDEVIAIYRKHGIQKAMIDIGGNIGLLGTDADDDPWRIGIQAPGKERGEYLCIVSLSDCSISTSGGYERFFRKNGKIYHHIIDPATGYPADSGIVSASVIAPMSVDSDALSKIFVMGVRKGIALIKSIPGTNAILVTEDGRVIVTEGLRGSVKITAAGKYRVEFR